MEEQERRRRLYARSGELGRRRAHLRHREAQGGREDHLAANGFLLHERHGESHHRRGGRFADCQRPAGGQRDERLHRQVVRGRSGRRGLELRHELPVHHRRKQAAGGVSNRFRRALGRHELARSVGHHEQPSRRARDGSRGVPGQRQADHQQGSGSGAHGDGRERLLRLLQRAGSTGQAGSQLQRVLRNRTGAEARGRRAAGHHRHERDAGRARAEDSGLPASHHEQLHESGGKRHADADASGDNPGHGTAIRQHGHRNARG